MLPNFLVIGAPKCGTSSLCHLLGRHPEVFMSRPKEIHFFGRSDPEKTYPWYESFFSEAHGKKAVGEGSTSYSHPEIIEACAAQIAERIPACRLIYMVRDPVERLESDWKMRRHEGWAAACVNDAVEQQPSLITLGLYWKNLSVYRRHFPDEQLLVVFLEDFHRDPDAELRRCWQHLRVDPTVVIEGSHRPRNAASGYRSYGTIASRLRALPLFAEVKRHLPGWALGMGKSVLTSKVRIELRWEPEMLARVAARFEDDSRQFLEFCGKDADFWHSAPGRARALPPA
jgi:hypothetical protein